MAAKSPTLSVKSREIIGVDQFSQRREVFDKHDTVFMPLQSPTTVVPVYKEVEPIISSNHGKTTSNFKRNTPGYSSMRESRTEERDIEFRTRKYSDNFSSELNQSDDVDYRRSMTERTRRLSKLRRDFMTSNLHEPGDSPFARTGTRSSMPATSIVKYKIESPNIYKFPFAEPYTTPTPTRKVILDLGPADVEGKENQDPENKTRHQSLPNHEDSPPKVDHQKLFEELLKRYSPQRKPVDWKLPPTRPRVVGSVPKSTSDSISKKSLERLDKTEDDDVFEANNVNKNSAELNERNEEETQEADIQVEIIKNGPERLSDEEQKNKNERDSKVSLTELEEKNDRVPELQKVQRQLSKESARKPPLETITDLTIPELLGKMTSEAEELESHQKDNKKVKRKRSFLDKLLGRNKNKQHNSK